MGARPNAARCRVAITYTASLRDFAIGFRRSAETGAADGPTRRRELVSDAANVHRRPAHRSPPLPRKAWGRAARVAAGLSVAGVFPIFEQAALFFVVFSAPGPVSSLAILGLGPLERWP